MALILKHRLSHSAVIRVYTFCSAINIHQIQLFDTALILRHRSSWRSLILCLAALLAKSTFRLLICLSASFHFIYVISHNLFFTFPKWRTLQQSISVKSYSLSKKQKDCETKKICKTSSYDDRIEKNWRIIQKMTSIELTKYNFENCDIFLKYEVYEYFRMKEFQ